MASMQKRDSVSPLTAHPTHKIKEGRKKERKGGYSDITYKQQQQMKGVGNEPWKRK